MYELQISDERLELAVSAATEAGEQAMDEKHTTTKREKHNGSVVTAADERSEAHIREVLGEHDAPVLGEEQDMEVGDADTYWVVDPIDGTKNFSHQQPLYGTSVALVEENEPVVGVFYMPDLDYLFYAVEGEGAYRGSERLEVTGESELGDAYYMLSGKGRNQVHQYVCELNRWVQQIGSALAGEAWVASGWCDVGVYGALAPWDMASGVVLVREAGGVMKNVRTGETNWDALKEGRVVFGNEVLVDQVIGSLSSAAEQAIMDATYDY